MPPDLDRLRESRQRPFPIVEMFGLSNPMYRVDSPDEAEGWAMDDADYRAWADAIDFLLSLADSGGRLERVVLCEHGFDESHRVFTDARGMERCAQRLPHSGLAEGGEVRLLAIPMRYFPNGWRNEVGKPHLTDALARKTVCGKPVGEDWDVRPLAEGSAHASDWWEFVDSALCRGCSVVWPTDKEESA